MAKTIHTWSYEIKPDGQGVITCYAKYRIIDPADNYVAYTDKLSFEITSLVDIDTQIQDKINEKEEIS